MSRLREYCASAGGEIRPALARIRSLVGLSVSRLRCYYRDKALRHWVREVVREQAITKAVVSSAMAPICPACRTASSWFVDVDSAKWANTRSLGRPLSAIYKREGRAFWTLNAQWQVRPASVFVTPRRNSPGVGSRMRRARPSCPERRHTEYFSPLHDHCRIHSASTNAIVFTGAMDYSRTSTR
jgi:hypothetical protein